MKIPTSQELSRKMRFNFKLQQFYLVEDIFIEIFGMTIILPRGATSDGASLPFFVKIFIKKTDPRIMIWAILHDYFFRTQFIPRRIANEIFRWGVKKDLGYFIGTTFGIALNLFSWIAWKQNIKKGLEKYPEAKKRLLKYICKK